MKSRKAAMLMILAALMANLLGCGGEVTKKDSKSEEYMSKETNAHDDSAVKETAVRNDFTAEEADMAKAEETSVDQNRLNIREIRDGVSDKYVMQPIQAPTEQILNEYHEKGYQNVLLTSHTVKKREGIIDEVYLQAQYMDPNGLYQVTEEIGALYPYWGTELGWINNMELGSLLDYDLTGFNGTYWKYAELLYDGKWDKYNIASELLGEEIINKYDTDSVIDIYFTFYNFDVLDAKIEDVYNFERIRFYKDSAEPVEIGTATVVINGERYRTSLKLASASGGSYHSDMLVAEGASICVRGENSTDNCYISYSIHNSDGGDIKLISEEEYNKAVTGAVIDVSEIEKNEIISDEELSGQSDDSSIGQIINYADRYNKVLDEIDAAMEYGSYCLWDLNHDGILELIVGHGEFSADYINDVWTIDDEGDVTYMGTFYGDQIYCEAPDGDGIYAVYGHMDHEVVTRIKIKDNEIAEEIVYDREVSPEEDYYSDNQIDCADLTDRNYLENF